MRSMDEPDMPPVEKKPSLPHDDGTDSLVRASSCVVYVERVVGHTNSHASTYSGRSSSHSQTVSTLTRTKASGMSMLLTMGTRKSTPPEKLNEGEVAAFKDSLNKSGIDTSGWGYNGTKSVEHLYWEAYRQRGCVITGLGQPGGSVKRVTRLVKIRLVAEIFGVEHVLVSRMQFMHDGQTVERKQVPLKKLKWSECTEEQLANDEVIRTEHSSLTEPWRIGCAKAIDERLGLTKQWQQQHLMEETDLYRYVVEDNCCSDGYPGLNTMYCIHEVTYRIRDPAHNGVHVIGLPEGQEFATTEGDFNFGQQDEDGLSIGTQLNIWTWIRDSGFEIIKMTSMSVPKFPSDGGKSEKSAKESGEAKPPGAAPVLVQTATRIRRVPLPAISARELKEMQARLITAVKSKSRPPSTALWACMDQLTTNWDTARRIARSISNPKYTLKQFNEDLTCFPELNLYLLEEKPTKPSAGSRDSGMSSGRTIGDEYQRTVGAFFALYWMMRLDLDGKDGFCNGVDEHWAPVHLEGDHDFRVVLPEKRMAFYENAQWSFFKRLLMKSGLLEEKRKTSMFKSETHIVVNEKRFMSMLALTAVHDIMKMNLILPCVAEEHAPYHGYAAGDTVGDHDHALSYIMDHYPDMLPSYRDLHHEEKLSVQFTQCNLCFNHGWLVQAEAPPGAIFTAFRNALVRDHKGQIQQRDVAFYFVHWLTDLAGAEPTPLAGCEKFVTKFPLPVLNSFLRSFEFVEKITSHSETEVMEEYLKVRWAEACPSPGPQPTGDSAIAKMRLLCMAQINAVAIVKAFDQLVEEDREVLSLEMGRTGCACQGYSAGLVPQAASTRLEGPAFLVYYGPAFLQSLGTDSPVGRLAILAEIYRCARTLWPASIAAVDVNVTIRIDVIKNMSLVELQEATHVGDSWVILKHNEREAFVERSSKKKLNKMIASSQCFQVLDLTACLGDYAVHPKDEDLTTGTVA